MYENMKSATLTFLVLLSLVLTWQIWTFQPDYALLKDTDYVNNPHLNEERKLSEVIVPEQVIFHVDDEHFLLNNNEILYSQFNEQWLTSRIEDISMMSTLTMNQILDESIELIFPAAIPGDIFLSMFTDVNEDISMPLSKVDRVFIYPNPETDKIHYGVISNNENRFADIETSFSVNDFEEKFLAEVERLINVFGYQVGPEQGQWSKIVYLPEETITVETISYTITPVSVDVFKQLLFNDPFSAKFFRQENGEETYTDGNRLINIINNGVFMDYINPIYSENPERGSRNVILSSIDFINGHGGWTDQYVLYDWVSNEVREEANFRLMLNGFPVISMDGFDVMSLYVFRTGNQTSRYIRPLFDLDQQPIDYARTGVDLPSGHDVIEELEKREYFDLSRLEKVAIGYEMKKWNAFVTVEPNWYIYYDQTWQKVPFDVTNEREVEDYGLE
ncbi:YycH family regulatory protein [Alkalihalobacterium alkalinitrilicum]|uniref:YycH family regulatory protein n=1 Tax=Alkalihalobacterium alkalinitrilicum TaxID=427920 RepID=UPI001303294B|nr:two-component system activity regulator YycH [Alkalihalobacterium alkalinitrilicum]